MSAFRGLLIFAFLLLLTGCQTTGGLGGSNWTVLHVLSPQETNIVDMDVEFGADGMVTTTTTHGSGGQDLSKRRYAVHGPLLTVYRPQGDLNMLHRIDGEEMFLTAENFQARLLRIN